MRSPRRVGSGSRALILWSLVALTSLPLPAAALEMTDMVVDSISMHPEVKEKIHVYRQVVSDERIARGGWLPSVAVCFWKILAVASSARC